MQAGAPLFSLGRSKTTVAKNEGRWTTPGRMVLTYNLVVEGTHTYFVGSGDQWVLVHNGKCWRLVDEWHHLYPKQFHDKFADAWKRSGKAGKYDQDSWMKKMTREDHRLKKDGKPHGVHTGDDNWNKQWKDFFKENPNPSWEEVEAKLAEMKKYYKDNRGILID